MCSPYPVVHFVSRRYPWMFASSQRPVHAIIFSAIYNLILSHRIRDFSSHNYLTMVLQSQIFFLSLCGSVLCLYSGYFVLHFCLICRSDKSPQKTSVVSPWNRHSPTQLYLHWDTWECSTDCGRLLYKSLFTLSSSLYRKCLFLQPRKLERFFWVCTDVECMYPHEAFVCRSLVCDEHMSNVL